MRDLLTPHSLMAGRALLHLEQPNPYSCSSTCIAMLSPYAECPSHFLIPTEHMPIFAARFGIFLQQLLAPQMIEGMAEGTYLALSLHAGKQHWFIIRINPFMDSIRIHDPAHPDVQHFEMHDLPARYHQDIMVTFRVWFTGYSSGSTKHE